MRTRRRWPTVLAAVLALLAAVVAIVAFGVRATPAPARGGSIEELVDRELSASGAPGVAYAVVTDGEIAYVGAQGVAEVGSSREVTPDTPFVTGSISKSFTALAVMQLVEAGKVDLDTQVSRYLGGFSGQPAAAVTIRQLLSHTSGFSTLQGNTSATGTNAKDDLARRVDLLAEVTPAGEPDDRWAYSNANYEILGRLIEVVSGQDYQTYVATHIVKPIGMDSSFVADGQFHESMATGHRPWFGTKRPIPATTTDRGTAPQGGVIASARDLARYAQVMMNGEDDVLSADGKAQMMRPASAATPFYGFGWFLDPGDGTVSHSGTSPGFETLATMVPADKKAVIVLVNAGSGLGFAETTQLRNAVTAKALDLEYAGEGSRWSQKVLFVGLVLLPIGYVGAMIWAWRHRTQVRAKSRGGLFGLFSLWFPLLTTLVAAWVILALVPILGGAPVATIRLFAPDFGLALIASAVTGVLWAVVRLGVAYTGRPRPA